MDGDMDRKQTTVTYPCNTRQAGAGRPSFARRGLPGFGRLLPALLAIVMLTGCGGGTEPPLQEQNRPAAAADIAAAQKESPSGASESVVHAEDETSSQGPLRIELIGSDRVILHLTHESLNEDLVRAESQFPRMYEIGFTKGEDFAMMFRMDHGWRQFAPNEMLKNGESFSWVLEQDQIPLSVNGNTVSCDMTHPGLADKLRACEGYVFFYYENADHPVRDEHNPPVLASLAECMTEAAEPVVVADTHPLPDTYRRCPQDDQFFQPMSADYLVLTYEMPVELYVPTWNNQTGVTSYGAFTDVKQGTARVTCLVSFDGDEYLGTKVRTEYGSVEESMLASLTYGHRIVPSELGYSDEADESLVTAAFFEESDRRMFGTLDITGHDMTYHGHHDQFRHFTFTARETDSQARFLKYLLPVPVSDRTGSTLEIPYPSMTYTAGETVTFEAIAYEGSFRVEAFSSMRSHQTGSNPEILETIHSLAADSRYFTPLTDDYLYVLADDSEETGAGTFRQNVELYAFNADGGLVQQVYRQEDAYFKTEGFSPTAYYGNFSQADWDKGILVFDETDQVFYFDWFAQAYGNGAPPAGENRKEQLREELLRSRAEAQGYYFSKP